MPTLTPLKRAPVVNPSVVRSRYTPPQAPIPSPTPRYENAASIGMPQTNRAASLNALLSRIPSPAPATTPSAATNLSTPIATAQGTAATLINSLVSPTKGPDSDTTSMVKPSTKPSPTLHTKPTRQAKTLPTTKTTPISKNQKNAQRLAELKLQYPEGDPKVLKFLSTFEGSTASASQSDMVTGKEVHAPTAEELQSLDTLKAASNTYQVAWPNNASNDAAIQTALKTLGISMEEAKAQYGSANALVSSAYVNQRNANYTPLQQYEMSGHSPQWYGGDFVFSNATGINTNTPLTSYEQLLDKTSGMTPGSADWLYAGGAGQDAAQNYMQGLEFKKSGGKKAHPYGAGQSPTKH
jgi:hypothetical protein